MGCQDRCFWLFVAVLGLALILIFALFGLELLHRDGVRGLATLGVFGGFWDDLMDGSMLGWMSPWMDVSMDG